MKMLNGSKGPAVRSLRAQADKETYPQKMQEELLNTENLTILEDMVEELIVENKKISGIKLATGQSIFAKIVILTTGTYLKSHIFCIFS